MILILKICNCNNRYRRLRYVNGRIFSSSWSQSCSLLETRKGDALIEKVKSEGEAMFLQMMLLMAVLNRMLKILLIIR